MVPTAVAETMLVAEEVHARNGDGNKAVLSADGESDDVAIALALASVELLTSASRYQAAQAAGVAAARRLEAAQSESFDDLFRALSG